MNDTYTELTKLRGERAQAISAEERRQAVEGQHRRDIEAADRRIAELEAQQRAKQLDDLRAQNADVVNMNHEAISALHDILAARPIDLVAIRMAMSAVDATTRRRAMLVSSALDLAEADAGAHVDRAAAAVGSKPAGGPALYAWEDSRMRHYATYIRSVEHSFGQVFDADIALALYVHGLQGEARQIAQGICYALTGSMYNPGANFDPAAAARLKADRP